MALRDINLIAPDVLERRFLLRHLLLWGGGLAAVLVLLAALYGYTNRMMRAAADHLPGGSGLQATMAAASVEISKEKQELSLVLREQEQLGALMGSRQPYSTVIARLAEFMNSQTWLKQLDLERDKNHIAHLKLQGMSLSQEHLGNFIQRLSGNPLFRSVILKYTQVSEARTAGASSVEFLIECDIAGE